MKRFSFALCLATLIAAISGCGEMRDLSGKITFPDGEPLDRGVVYFCSATFLARGTVQPDGTFDVGSFGESDGLPPGEYKVYVDLVDAEVEGEVEEGELPQVYSLVDAKYRSVETTPLTFTVPGERTFDFVVERPGKSEE